MFELRLESVGSLHQPAALATSVGGKAFVAPAQATAEMVEKQYPVGQRAQLSRHFAEQVVLEAVRLIGPAYECRVQLQDGTPDEAIRTLEEVVGLMQARVEGAPRIQLGDPEKLRLLLESAYICLVYAHDRQFAVSLSGIRTVPHQIEAVYRKMLPQTRLRFLLADDPGAGKTILAGLLVKELKLREAMERILVLCPPPLAIQWQNELLRWFGESFEIIFLAVDQQQPVNPCQRATQVISSIGNAKQEDVRERVFQRR